MVARPAQKMQQKVYLLLRKAHPDAHCELDHRSPFELLVATVLSAQSTDVVVNQVTPGLFGRYPDPRALAGASPADVESCINRLGMFRQKAKNLIGLAQNLVERHGGEVPETLEELVLLPGVGRKTANVVLGVAFGKPSGVVVDTHVSRISQRLGWTNETSPEKIERDLMALLPQSEWDLVSHTLIFHGRRVCTARRPACSTCAVSGLCASAFHAELVGRKPTKKKSTRPGSEQKSRKKKSSSQRAPTPPQENAAPQKNAAPQENAAQQAGAGAISRPRRGSGRA